MIKQNTKTHKAEQLFQVEIDANLYTTLTLLLKAQSRRHVERIATKIVEEYEPNIELNPAPQGLVDVTLHPENVELSLVSIERNEESESELQFEKCRNNLELGRALNEAADRLAGVNEVLTLKEREALARLILKIGSSLLSDMASILDAVRDQRLEYQISNGVIGLQQAVAEWAPGWIERFIRIQGAKTGK